MFKIVKKDKKTKARLGVLSTPHGKIETPAYVIVATHAEIKCLKPSDIKKTRTQIVICNTYHLWDDVLKANNPKSNNMGSFVLNRLKTELPTMTDSGGFQVFSLGFGQKNHIGKILNSADKRHEAPLVRRKKNVKITDKGVYFSLDGKRRFLGPALSVKLQEKLGADIIFAFDECTSPLDGFDYNKKALERTHKWAEISLKHKIKNEKHAPYGSRASRSGSSGKRQLLFGIVQGGRFKSLRVKSAKFIASLPFDGIGIGGSFGRNEMVKTLEWIVPHLPEEKPRHLLGIGKIKDVFNAIENGVDFFDCVIPTREARHGRIYTKNGYFDISKIQNNNIRLEKGCKCPACQSGITRTRLHELFKSAQPIRQAQGKRYATLHNVWFFNNLLEQIRKSIRKDEFSTFKKNFLKNWPIAKQV